MNNAKLRMKNVRTVGEHDPVRHFAFLIFNF